MEFLKEDPAMPQGRYARMAYGNLKEHRPQEFQRLEQTGQLLPFLNNLQKETSEAIETRIQDLKKANPITPKGDKPSYLELAQQEEWARLVAEEEILPIMVLRPPEDQENPE